MSRNREEQSNKRSKEVRLPGTVLHGLFMFFFSVKDQNGQPWNTKVISRSELEYVTLENTTDRYKMYKGKYNKNHVLIKVMLGELQTDNE